MRLPEITEYAPTPGEVPPKVEAAMLRYAAGCLEAALANFEKSETPRLDIAAAARKLRADADAVGRKRRNEESL